MVGLDGAGAVWAFRAGDGTEAGPCTGGGGVTATKAAARQAAHFTLSDGAGS